MAALAQQNALPEPSLDVDSIAPSSSNFHDIMRLPPPTRGYSADDPWNASRITTSPNAPSKLPALGSINNGAQSSIAGTGLPREWWKKQETIFVNVLGHQGFVLNRYLVYEVSSDVRKPTRSFTMWLSPHLAARAPRTSEVFRICISLGRVSQALSLPSLAGTTA